MSLALLAGPVPEPAERQPALARTLQLERVLVLELELELEERELQLQPVASARLAAVAARPAERRPAPLAA